MEDSDIPENILEAANSVRLDLLPENSKIYYKKEYLEFCKWRSREHVHAAGDTILLAYFVNLSKDFAPSSLWPKYSMLRACLELKERVEINKYGALIRFIKKTNVGYRAKKAKVFTRDQVSEFLCNAPDDTFLMMKVAILIGLGGACRTNELMKLSIEDVEVLQDKLVVTIPDLKTYKKRLFAVVSEGVVNPVTLYKKYIALRPGHITHKRLFVSYRNGKCTVQPCGIHLFSKIPEKIATYLKLENPTLYTGHYVRRSSATFLVNAGGDILDLQELGGWESSKVARGYLEDNVTKKVLLARKIQVGNVSVSSASCGLEQNASSQITEHSLNIMDTTGVILKFNNCQNIEVHIHK